MGTNEHVRSLCSLHGGSHVTKHMGGAVEQRLGCAACVRLRGVALPCSGCRRPVPAGAALQQLLKVDELPAVCVAAVEDDVQGRSSLLLVQAVLPRKLRLGRRLCRRG